MNIDGVNEFKKNVLLNFDKNVSALALVLSEFKEDGNTVSSKMKGINGVVELFYGPPEYHVAILISENNGKKWVLSDLACLKDVYSWMLANKPKIENRKLLEVEVEYVFRFLSDCLSKQYEFLWLKK